MYAQPYVYLTCPGQQLLLQRDRIGHNAIGFEVSDEETGQVLAFGFIRFEDLYNVVKDATQDPRNAGKTNDACTCMHLTLAKRAFPCMHMHAYFC